MRVPLVCVALLVVLIASPIDAQPASARVIRFDPPNPTDGTRVAIHVSGPNQSSCVLNAADAAVDGSTVTVTVHASSCGLYPPSPDAWFHVAVPVSHLPAGRYDVAVRMEMLGSSTAIGTSMLVVRDSAPPFEVEPDVLTGLGGESVDLVGKGIDAIGCRICPKLLVHLGDTTVDVTNEFNSFDSIHVPVPPHAPGIVDVSIERDGVIVYHSNSALEFVGSGPGDPTFFERVLIPVIINGPGAFGSQWKTDLTLYNASNDAIPGSLTGVQPRSLVTVSGTNAPSGLVLPLPRRAAKKVTIGLLARDLSKQAEALGTELPVVREAGLQDGGLSLLNAPADARFRVALRLFGIDDVRQVIIRIRPMDNTSNDLLVQEIRLAPTSESAGLATFGYIGDLLTQFPQIAGHGPLHVEIDASDARVWGFISVTNNETQQVTVISPQ
jgi:hypothetical protein